LISNGVDIVDWPPVRECVLDGRCLSLWVVPGRSSSDDSASQGGRPINFRCADIREWGLTLTPYGGGAPILGDHFQLSALLRNRGDRALAVAVIEWEFVVDDKRTSAVRSILSFSDDTILPSAAGLGLTPDVPRGGEGLRPGDEYLIIDDTPFCRDRLRYAGWDRTTLHLDGAFFVDGTFVGPNRSGIWESVCRRREVALEVASAAAGGIAHGIEARRIMGGVERLLNRNEGESLLNESLAQRRRVWELLQRARRNSPEEHVVRRLATWAAGGPPALQRR
jgi:hypothetical protein